MREPELYLRLQFADLRFGPGKAQLLEGIAAGGSISAAGRAMGMSYRRAWSLVEEMNAAFAAPLVQAARGGAGHGGARLTAEGTEILALYRRMERLCAEATRDEVAALAARLAPAAPDA